MSLWQPGNKTNFRNKPSIGPIGVCGRKNSIHEIAPEPYEILSFPDGPVQLDILS
jgi:hypothetical protein